MRLLNRYLEDTGDYAGLAVLRYYAVRRALVWCKVALLRARKMRPAAEMPDLFAPVLNLLRGSP